MPDDNVIELVKTAKKFRCPACNREITAKTITGACIGVDIGIAVDLPDGKIAVYRNGLDKEGNPISLAGKVVRLNQQGKVYWTNEQGERFVWVGNEWQPHSGAIEGEHTPRQMKEVK